jgi:hypothetical protein
MRPISSTYIELDEARLGTMKLKPARRPLLSLTIQAHEGNSAGVHTFPGENRPCCFSDTIGDPLSDVAGCHVCYFLLNIAQSQGLQRGSGSIVARLSDVVPSQLPHLRHYCVYTEILKLGLPFLLGHHSAAPGNHQTGRLGDVGTRCSLTRLTDDLNTVPGSVNTAPGSG